jgi:hypothetical protein
MCAALLMVLTASGCGKKSTPTSPTTDNHNLDIEQAQQIATTVGSEFQGMEILQSLGGLFEMAGPSAGTQRARNARPARAGRMTQDNGDGTYEIVAYNAAGQEVPWETTPYDQIQRVVVNWNIQWDWTSDSGPSFSRGHALGSYDVSGFLPSATELVISGAARDSMKYRFTGDGYDLNGDAIWVEGVEALRWSKDTETNPYPLSGRESIFVDQNWTYTSAQANSADHQKANVVITFNGTQWADLTVDDRYHFKLDLSTGQVSQPAM